MTDIHINIPQTMAASDDLSAQARRIEGRVREFAGVLTARMNSDDWSGAVKDTAVSKLADLVTAFDKLTDKCQRTGVVIRQIAESMNETERANTNRFLG